MPFPLFSNPFHKPASNSTRSPCDQSPSSYSHNRTKPISRQSKSSISSASDHAHFNGIHKPVVSLSSSTSSTVSPDSTPQRHPISIRNRAQSLAASNSRAHLNLSSSPASQDALFKSESTHLIKKLKSYGSASEKAVLGSKKKQPRSLPLRLTNQHKPQPAHSHRSSTSAGYPSALSPRSRSSSAAATVFDIVRSSRRRDETTYSSTVTPFTPPLPIPSSFLARQPIDLSSRDLTKPHKFSPSPLSLHPNLNSRPNAHRRASSLDSITTGFPPSRSPHQQYFKSAGFLQTSRKFSACSSGMSHSECSEEVITQSSHPGSAQITPLSSAHLRSRFNSRDKRHPTPRGLQPRVAPLSSRAPLSPKAPFPSHPIQPGELDPLELASPSSPANWTLNISGSSIVGPTTCLVPDLPGTILTLKQTPTDYTKFLLEPTLQKVIRVGADGNQLVEWEIRLALPTRPRLNSSNRMHDLSQQPSPRTRNKTKPKLPAPKLLLNSDTRRTESPIGSQAARPATTHHSAHGSSSLSSLFSASPSPGNCSSRLKQLNERPSSPLPSPSASSASCSSSSLSPAEEADHEAGENKNIIETSFSRTRFDTYVPAVTTVQAQPSSSDYFSIQTKIETKSRHNLVMHPKTREGDIAINDGDDIENGHGLAFNLERQLAHSKLLGISDTTANLKKTGSLDRTNTSEYNTKKDEEFDFSSSHFYRSLSGNSNRSSNLDGNSVLEKSYWSETDTTTGSSIINMKTPNDEPDDD
ncbi:hypothetical protein VP01_83g10 [Puccinia sorghi]|uniref:Uncharacterized protein n=1 Tax=Puccinia sorghi TaxID=27349 RepID=A0A0L6UA63_9BASI|nr:hypothetical protein VP01_83g10 [Puccinia sorghi]